jgi:hypothetical protein
MPFKKKEGFMENLKEFHDIWAIKFPWVEQVIGDNG